MDSETCRRFERLFQGRYDAYGDAGAEPKAVRKPLTRKEWDWHLLDPDGARPLGIYPLTDKLGVHWGCTDIDTGEEAIVQARNLQNVLKVLGITSWVERSRSKGWHVWVFAEELVDANHMRNALLLAHQVAGVPPTEVNPKQVSLQHTEHGLGNWVRLPYPGGDNARLEDRQVIVGEDGLSVPLVTFTNKALATRVSAAKLAEVAALYIAPPPPKRTPIVGEYDGDLEVLRSKLSGLGNRIFIEGPLQARAGKAGRDRSGTLARLAYTMAEGGALTPAEALALLRDADLRWGKYHDRADGEQQLEKIIDWAWSQT
jgi:hypothetical protein